MKISKALAILGSSNAQLFEGLASAEFSALKCEACKVGSKVVRSTFGDKEVRKVTVDVLSFLCPYVLPYFGQESSACNGFIK
jgi:hypothetical protein